VSVYSETTTFLFRFGPYVLLATSLAGAFITPLLGGTPLVSFRFD
jgi:formate hydrogenlyase subunit 4